MLVRDAGIIVRGYGVSILVAGFTIVALGTSLPELVVGVFAGMAGEGELVIGNILGSNMANFGLVLGLSALIRPIGIPGKDGRVELFGLIFSSAFLWLVAADGMLSRYDGMALLALGIAFIAVSLWNGGAKVTAIDKISAKVTRPGRREKALAAFGALSGAALLAVGANLVVRNAAEIALGLGVSEFFIGLTLVAVGTSLPEIVTSAVASVRKTDALAIGNVIGSNVLNILFVLGLTLVAAPVSVSQSVIWRDLPILLVVTVAVVAVLRVRGRLERAHGLVLMIGYFAYLVIFAMYRAG